MEKYYTVDDYQAEEEDEISFKRGLTVEVLQKSLDGWWVVKVDKVVGLAPATFLKKVESGSAQVLYVGVRAWAIKLSCHSVMMMMIFLYRSSLFRLPPTTYSARSSSRQGCKCCRERDREHACVYV